MTTYCLDSYQCTPMALYLNGVLWTQPLPLYAITFLPKGSRYSQSIQGLAIAPELLAILESGVVRTLHVQATQHAGWLSAPSGLKLVALTTETGRYLAIAERTPLLGIRRLMAGLALLTLGTLSVAIESLTAGTALLMLGTALITHALATCPLHISQAVLEQRFKLRTLFAAAPPTYFK